MLRTPQAAHASRSPACRSSFDRAAEVQDRLDPGVAQDVFGRDERSQPRAGPGAVRDVDGVDARSCRVWPWPPSTAGRSRAAAAIRRWSPIGGRPGGRPARIARQRGGRLGLDAGWLRDGQHFRPPQRFDGQGTSRMWSGVVPQHPPTAETPAPRSGGRSGQIFGRTEINPPVLHFPGQAGVGLHDQRQGRHAYRPLHGAQQAVGPDAAVQAPGDRLGGAGGQRASIRSTDSPATVSPHSTTVKERTNGTSGRLAMAAAQRSSASRFGCVSKRMKSAPPSIRPSTCSRIISRSWLRTGADWVAARSSRPRKRPIGSVGHFAGQFARRRRRSSAAARQGELGQRHPVRPECVGRQYVGAGVAVVP